MYNNILDVKGLKVGQAQNEEALTVRKALYVALMLEEEVQVHEKQTY